MPCSNSSLEEGMCEGLPICGWCYDGGEIKVVSKNYETFNLIVIGIALPTIGVLGLIGDGLSAFIYSRKEMISSLNVYLCALAFSDIIIISTAFFMFFLESVRKWSLFASETFAVSAPYVFPLGLTAQSLSVFLTVAAAFDCLVLVAAPTSTAQRFCSVRTSIIMLVLIVVSACIYNSPHLFEITLIDCWSIPYQQQSNDVCPTELRMNQDYLTIYYAYMYTIVMAAGPVALLILINSTIVVTMRRSKKPEQSDSDIITLVLVVCLFITCNVLPLTVNLLELMFDIVNSYMFDLSNLMVVLNSSCNFLIYYAFGSNFRRTLKQYVSAVWSPSRQEQQFKRIPLAIEPPNKEMLI